MRWLPVAASLALGGCSGDGAALLSGGSVPEPGLQGPGGATAALAVVGETTPDKPKFDPFSDRSETDRPSREVMQNPSRDEVMKSGAIAEFSIGRPEAVMGGR